MRKVQILIGCSGSGKSTFAEKVMSDYREESLKKERAIPTGTIFSADSYQNPTALNYTREALENNHNQCLRSYVREVSTAVYLDPRVSALYIVDNTNTTIAEIAPYFRVAQAFGYDVELVWFSANPVDCHNRNKHGTPLPIIERQDRQIADLRIPPYWKYTAKRVFQQDIQKEGVPAPAEISLKGKQ